MEAKEAIKAGKKKEHDKWNKQKKRPTNKNLVLGRIDKWHGKQEDTWRNQWPVEIIIGFFF